MIIEEREKLNNQHEVKKEKDKNADIEIAKLREELLKVKKEKHNLNTNLKVQTDEAELLKKETVELKRESEKIESKFVKIMDSLETKTKDVDALKKGNDDLKVILDKTKADLSKLNLVKQTDVQPLYECGECGSRLQTYKSLKQHIIIKHYRNKATQIDKISKFEEYPCYYCDEIIVSKSDLEKHVQADQRWRYSPQLLGIAPNSKKWWLFRRLLASNHDAASCYSCAVCVSSYT